MGIYKKILIGLSIIAFSSIISTPVFAAGWTKGISRNAWWYDLGNGNFHKNSWQWIDGNSDGIAECYLFDNDGWMYENTKTPDGYDVNSNGAWTVNGIVQTKKLNFVTTSKTSKSGSTSKFSGGGSGGSGSGSSRFSGGGSGGSSGSSGFSGSSLSNTDSLSSNTSKTRISRTLVQEDDGYYYVSRYSDGSVEKEKTRLKTEEELAREREEKLINKKEDYRQEIVRLVNEERTKRGIAKLSIDNSLMEIADIRAEEITENFSHTRPDGTSFRTLYDDYGLENYSGGENIAMGQKNPEDVMRSWMNSSGHRENILRSHYTSIGIGIAVKNGYAYWVQNFYSE